MSEQTPVEFLRGLAERIPAGLCAEQKDVDQLCAIANAMAPTDMVEEAWFQREDVKEGWTRGD